MEKDSEKLTKKEFSCAIDAQKAWEKFQHAQRKSLFPITSRIEPLTRPKRRDKRGRPKKSEIPEMETVYTLHVDIAFVTPELIEEQELRMGYFVLATNHQDAAELPAEQMLRGTVYLYDVRRTHSHSGSATEHSPRTSERMAHEQTDS